MVVGISIQSIDKIISIYIFIHILFTLCHHGAIVDTYRDVEIVLTLFQSSLAVSVVKYQFSHSKQRLSANIPAHRA